MRARKPTSPAAPSEATPERPKPTPPAAPKPTTYGLEEVAAIVGVHVETIRRAIRSGELCAAKLRRNYRVSRAELARWWAAKGGGEPFEGEG